MNDEVLKMPIEKLNLSNRSYNVLKRAGYNYISQTTASSIYKSLTLTNPPSTPMLERKHLMKFIMLFKHLLILIALMKILFQIANIIILH